MIPTKNWGDGKGGLIGCSIRFCMFDAVNDVVWHILVCRKLREGAFAFGRGVQQAGINAFVVTDSLLFSLFT